VTDYLDYVLSSLRRAADNAYPWSLTPTEAGALVAEVERLRAQRALDNDALARAWDEGRDMERAATVAWLREPGEYVDPACARLADCIERGVARRERKP
jgi:hypothetical protein